MKKKLFYILILIFVTMGCTKNNLTLSSFIEKANDNAYFIENNKKGYESYQYIKEIYYAVNRENAYDIQFLELENDDYAKKFYDVNMNALLEYVNSDTYVKNKNSLDYQVYHLENDSKYYLVIRSKNNILYIDAPIDYINEIEEFLSDLDIDF